MAGPTWQIPLLRALGAPATPENLRFVNAWRQAEGGTASYNPFNTTQSASGATNYNSIGVKNYPSFQTGIHATVQTLLNGRYAPIVSLLRSGRASAVQEAQAVANSPWGTGSLILKVLGAPVSPQPLPGAPPGTAAAAASPSGAAAAPPFANLASILNLGNQAVGLPRFNPLLSSLMAPPAAAGVNPNPSSPASVNAPTAGTSAPVGKWVRVAAGADRAGVNLQPSVLGFVATVARDYGKPLTIGTGTNHNQFVIGTNRQSQHWTGHAADIPASGASLTRLGQTALIAAGMTPAQARKQQGGLFNIGRYQIIFNSMEGGNHYNHLHVGVR